MRTKRVAIGRKGVKVAWYQRFKAGRYGTGLGGRRVSRSYSRRPYVARSSRYRGIGRQGRRVGRAMGFQ